MFYKEMTLEELQANQGQWISEFLDCDKFREGCKIADAFYRTLRSLNEWGGPTIPMPSDAGDGGVAERIVRSLIHHCFKKWVPKDGEYDKNGYARTMCSTGRIVLRVQHFHDEDNLERGQLTCWFDFTI